MCARPSFLFALALVCQDVWLPAQANDLAAPLVAVVADGARAETLDAMLRAAGMRRRRIAVADCTPAALRLADVVVVDWPEGELAGALPLGELERWDRPTVFVGTSGERFAQSWGLPTPGELAGHDGGARGPELWSFAPPAGAKTEVLRQGHLFHFPCELPAVMATAEERAWWVATVRHAARFVTDRPIVRHATANGAPLPAEETARRQRIEAAATGLSLDPSDMNVLLQLPDLLGGEQGEAATTLLQDLIAEGPGAGTTRNNWHNWLKPRLGAMVWDPLSHVWRLDLLAYRRGVATSTLAGDARADGGEREPEAVALATRVARHYGGRALDDLATFTCWQGEVCYLWDRRAGVFRMENHHVLPAGARATPWQVSVLDTAADRELIWGGGPPPRPRVSARGSYGDVLMQLFLPVLLLEPGTSLRRDRDRDSAGQQALVVRLALPGLDPKRYLRLLVDAETGTIASVEQWQGNRALSLWSVDSTTACGPLQVVTKWTADHRRRRSQVEYAAPTWNPELPPGIATATDLLTERREGDRER
jgi:hypothetical protein